MDGDDQNQAGQGGTVNPVQVQRFLEGLDYPADKRKVVEHAKSNGADSNTLATLEKLPEESFETPADISQALGEVE